MSSSSGFEGVGTGYTALRERLGLWNDPHRALLRVDGPRAQHMLAGLLSADIDSMASRSTALSFVLSAKGRPLAVPRVLRLNESLVLDVSRAALSGLGDHFATYLPPRFATVTELESASRLSVLGPLWAEAASRVGIRTEVTGLLQNVELPAGDGRPATGVVRDSEDGGGLDIYDWSGACHEKLATIVRELGGAEVSDIDHETWRIEEGVPRFGIDVTKDNLPQETGLAERAVSFEKGCYTGQEVVARIHYRGHVNRRLLGVRWAGAGRSAALSTGAELYRKSRIVAKVTSPCVSPRFGSIALAYVRRESGVGDRLAGSPDSSADWLVTDLPFTST